MDRKHIYQIQHSTECYLLYLYRYNTNHHYKNYKQQFYKDFKEYFRSTSTKDGYPQLLSVYYDINHRWQDGNPGSSIINNLNFTCFFLYMTIVQQSILEYAEEAEEVFSEKTPYITSIIII